MNDEIVAKLHTALYAVAPLVSDRERIIAQMGEVIWVETLEKMLLALPEDARAVVIGHLNAGELDKGVEMLEANNIDIDAIITEVATSVMDSVLKSGKGE